MANFPTNGNDTIIGSTSDDFIDALAGNDSVNGRSGNDTLFGWTGKDTLYGGIGDDGLAGEDGNDFLRGGEGNDTLDGGSGFDTADYSNASASVFVNLASDDPSDTGTASGGAGNDTLFSIERVIGSDFNDDINSSSGDRHLEGGKGNDELNSGSGDDTLEGGSGDDYLFSEGAEDYLSGGSGNDTLDGWDDNDTLLGGSGNDSLLGSSGTSDEDEVDVLIGGEGKDTFVLGEVFNNVVDVFYQDNDPITPGREGYAKIRDFNRNKDKIELGGTAGQYILRSAGSNTEILLAEAVPDLIGVVEGVKNLSLGSDYFTFVT